MLACEKSKIHAIPGSDPNKKVPPPILPKPKLNEYIDIQIIEQSGAHCEIDKNAPRGCHDKNLVIRGSPEAVEMTKTLYTISAEVRSSKLDDDLEVDDGLHCEDGTHYEDLGEVNDVFRAR